MKRRFGFLLFLILTVVFLAGCQKEGPAGQAGGEASGPESFKKGDSQLRAVAGAKPGSMSSWVEDREVWKDFVDQGQLASAQREFFGIHLPRILLDSKDAQEANREIDGLVQEIRDQYAGHKKDMEGVDTGIYASFSVYQDEKILSIMVETSNVWEGDFPKISVFNFSLPDGKFIQDAQVMKAFGLEEDQILGVVEDSLREAQDLDRQVYYNDVRDSSYFYNPTSLTGLVFHDLWDNDKSKDGQIFIDEMGKPNFVFRPYASVDMGQSPVVLKLKANRFDQGPISEDYLKMARRLGMDPGDQNHKAFVIYLGSAADPDSLKAPLEKLYAWTSLFSNYQDPSMLMAMKMSPVGDTAYLIGEECYLVIPKYRNAAVSLKELEISQDGQLKEVDNDFLDNLSATGTTFVCQNISDIAPNGKITIRYRDDVLDFSPSISLKDGSLVLPPGVTNGEAVLDWKTLMETEAYSQNMFDRILSIMRMG